MRLSTELRGKTSGFIIMDLEMVSVIVVVLFSGFLNLYHVQFVVSGYKHPQPGRATFMDYSTGIVLLDQYILPRGEVISYVEGVSGLNADRISHATYSYEKLRTWMLDAFSSDVVFVGHGLEGDFRSLELIPNRIIDTAEVYGSSENPNCPASLSNLSRQYLGLILDRRGGHDSLDDVRAVRSLVRHLMHQGGEMSLNSVCSFCTLLSDSTSRSNITHDYL